MHENLLPLIEELEQAVEDRNAPAAAAIIRRLNQETIYSGNEVYERLREVEGSLGAVLFHGLKPDEFGRLVSEDKHLHTYKIWDVLEEISEHVNADALWAIKDYLGFPSTANCPKLHATLAVSGNVKITEWLIETIDRLAGAEAEEGSSLSAHERTMSAFQFVRWGPDDKGLGDCVRLLAARGDDRARAACGGYLISLPWGADRKATLALIEGMSATRAVENLGLFREALAVHRQPAVLRTWLWAAIGEDNPGECLLGTIGDLAKADNDADRFTFVEYLHAALSQAVSQNIALDRKLIATAAEKLDTTGWSLAVRGCYGSTLKTQLPEADASLVSKRIDRAAIAVARAWEAVRLDHMGCLIPLAVMIVMGFLVNWGLDRLLGGPTRISWLPAVLFWAWIALSLANVRTHFSGHETIQRKIYTGVIYFLLLLAALSTAVLVRIG